MNKALAILAAQWQRLMPLRFVIVGGWNTVFSYLFFACLYHLMGGGWGDVAVQFVTAIVGISNAYVLHRILTFKSRGIWWKEYLRFYAVYGIQSILQMLFFFVFATWIGFNGYVVQVILTASATAFSYWAHRNFSFAKQPAQQLPDTLQEIGDHKRCLHC